MDFGTHVTIMGYDTKAKIMDYATQVTILAVKLW